MAVQIKFTLNNRR